MPAESEEVAVHRLHIHLEVGSTLCTIHHDWDAVPMGNLGNLGDRVHGSEDIADVSDADEFGALCYTCSDVTAAN